MKVLINQNRKVHTIGEYNTQNENKGRIAKIWSNISRGEKQSMKILAKQNRELIMINAQNTQNELDLQK